MPPKKNPSRPQTPIVKKDTQKKPAKKVPLIQKKKLGRIQEDSGAETDKSDLTDSESDDSDLTDNDVIENIDEGDEDDKLEADDEVDDESASADSSEESNDEYDDKESDDGKDDECMYRFNKKNNDSDEEDEFDEDDFFEEDDKITVDNMYVPNDKRITRNRLTKFERVRLLGERARQLSLGAKPMIKGVAHMDPKQVARMELNMKVMPLIIERLLPSGQKERWKVSELEIVN